LTTRRIAEEAFGVEQVQFKKTDRRVNPRKSDPLFYRQGTVPVLISAPHAVRYIRAGKIKVSDSFTGSLAYLLGIHCGYHVLATRKLYGGDPDSDERCLFKERLGQIAAATPLALVVDLHAAPRDYPFDLDCRASGGQIDLVSHLKKSTIDNVSLNALPITGQNPVADFCSSKLGITTLRLKINRRYRAPNRNGEDFRRLFEALTGLEQLIGQPPAR
jgi:hypothetical protein